MIGRADEVAAVARFVEQVPSGPAGLLVEGEPGIGKTTVWLEAIRASDERGYRVLQSRPAEAEADLSFAALGDLVGGVVHEVGPSLPAPQRHALEVALRLREADEPADPLTTASALLSAVTILSGVRPLIIAIDDAQWMDQASRRAIEFAIRRLPRRVGVVVATRLQDGVPRSLDLERALAAERRERLVLGPLSLAVLHHLIQARLGVNLSRPMLVRVAEAASGNPFHALEISGALARGHATPALGDLLPVPRSLQDLLSDRVDRLSPTARSVVSAAAALSHPTSQTVAAAVGSDLDLEDALLEADEAGILISDGDRLRFSHPLLATAIYGSLTAGGRRHLHRDLAAIVDDPEERARHLARSITAADDAAASAIEEGAALATRRGAPESAAELYEAACRLTPAGQPEDLARRMLGGADARSVAGDLGGARALATRALESGQTGSLRARALLLLGSLASYTDTIDARLGYQERALTEAGDDLELRVDILLALFEQIMVDPEQAGRRADEAIGLLRERDDPGRLAQALVDKFIAEAVLGHGATDGLLDEAVALEARSGPVEKYQLLWYHWIDDLEATRARHRLHDAQYRERGDVVSAAEIVEFLAMAEFRAGNWNEAERSIEAACDTLAQLELRGPFIASFTDRSIIDAHRGRIERARQTLLGILGTDRLDPFWRLLCHSAQGTVEFCAGDHDAAVRAWTAMGEEARLLGWIDFLDDRSEPDHVEALVALGRLTEALGVLDHLEWRGRTLPRPWIDTGLPRARALVLAAQGRLPEALAVVGSAPVTASLPFEQARLLLVRGQIERRANRKLAARDSLTKARAMFEDLGSPPWARRATDEIARLGLRHRASNELTESERRIAELAAAGMTNRQVAEVAFVSPKTVEANLARVYRKLGIRSRAELGSRMSAGSRERGANS